MGKNQSKPGVAGTSIYKDKRGRDVYYDRFTHNGYLILESNVKRFQFYQNRLLFPVIVFALLLNFNLGAMHVGWIEAGVVAIITFLGLEFFFRFKFLKTLTIIPNFVPEKKLSIIEQVNDKNERNPLMLKAFLYMLLGVVLILYAYQQNNTGFNLIIMWVLSIFVIGVGCTYLYAVLKRKK